MGIISPNRIPLKSGISEIVDEPALVTPGTTLWIRNAFIIPGFGNFRIIAQEIEIYLIKQDEVDPTNIAYSIGTEVTNATNPDAVPAISMNNADIYE
jgi:hypothetical protein